MKLGSLFPHIYLEIKKPNP